MREILREHIFPTSFACLVLLDGLFTRRPACSQGFAATCEVLRDHTYILCINYYEAWRRVNETVVVRVVGATVIRG
jgi:hypothetical protein